MPPGPIMATATLVSHGATTPLSSQFHQPWCVVWTMSPMARTERSSIEHVGCDAPGSFPADTLQAAVAHLPRKIVARTGTAQNRGSCVTDLPCRALLLWRRVHPCVSRCRDTRRLSDEFPFQCELRNGIDAGRVAQSANQRHSKIIARRQALPLRPGCAVASLYLCWWVLIFRPPPPRQRRDGNDVCGGGVQDAPGSTRWLSAHARPVSHRRSCSRSCNARLSVFS